MSECPICFHPVADTGVICHKCTGHLRRDLERLASRILDLQQTLIRQDRIDDPGGHAAEQPLMFSYAASDLDWVAVNTLTTWTRDVEEQRGITMPVSIDLERPVGPACRGCQHETCLAILRRPAEVPIEARCALWLSTQVDWLRHREYAEQVYGELSYCCATVTRAVDRPAPRQYVGPCDVCGKDMYAARNSGIVKCRPCDLEYDVADRRAWLLEQADDQLVHAGLLARALSDLGEPIKPERIRQWASRGLLSPKAHDAAGRPLYAVREVRDLLRNMQLRRQLDTAVRRAKTA